MNAAIPPPSTNPATAAPMITSRLCVRSWPRQSVAFVDLAAQLLDGDAELGAVGLDRAPDLLRRARAAHRASTFAGLGAWSAPGGPSGVAGCGAVSVALIS